MSINKQEIREMLVEKKKETEAAIITARCGAMNELRSKGVANSKRCARDCFPSMLIVQSGRITQLLKYLKKIDQALINLRNDAYGICRVCEDEIPKKRLQACPETDICVNCKTATELMARTPTQTRKFFPNHKTEAIVRQI